MQHTHPGVAERFVKDVADEVAILMKDPSGPTTGVVSSAFEIINFSVSNIGANFVGNLAASGQC